MGGGGLAGPCGWGAPLLEPAGAAFGGAPRVAGIAVEGGWGRLGGPTAGGGRAGRTAVGPCGTAGRGRWLRRGRDEWVRPAR